ncbi:hypothetical protein FRB95_011696 [Tulasnella sp. JGI-2019a]|nr:hypothetical protein FRB95_011696 [Tulasnella sp. JGI-2019a]
MSQAYLDDSHHPHANPLCMTTTGYLNHLGDWPWVNTGPPVVDFVSSLPTQSSNIQSITESNAKGPNIHIWASTHECQDAIPRLVAPQATVPLNLIVGGPIKGLVADPIAHRPTLKTEPPRHDEAPYEFYCFNMDADGRRCRSGPHRGRSAIAKVSMTSASRSASHPFSLSYKHWMSCSGHSR